MSFASLIRNYMYKIYCVVDPNNCFEFSTCSKGLELGEGLIFGGSFLDISVSEGQEKVGVSSQIDIQPWKVQSKLGFFFPNMNFLAIYN